MNVLVFGAGALGSLIGGLLSRQHEVTLVGRKRHVETIRRQGLRIIGRSELVVQPQAVEDVADASFPHLVLLTTKTYDTATSIQALRPFWRTATFASLQCGMEKEELLALRARKVLAATTYQRATLIEPGKVHQSAHGETLLGPHQATGPDDVDRVLRAFQEAEIPVRPVFDVTPELWLSTLIGSCIEPLTALLRVDSAALCRSERLLEAARAVLEEGVRVAAARGVAIRVDDALKQMCAVAEAAGDRKSAMLHDLERERRTEIDALNGALVDLGTRRGVNCPLNRLITLLVKAAETKEGNGARV